jgi:hypothetical protein
MIPIYVNHYDILTERKKYLQSVIKECTWVTEPSKETITDDEINEWYLNSNEKWQEKCKHLYSSISHYGLT